MANTKCELKKQHILVSSWRALSLSCLLPGAQKEDMEMTTESMQKPFSRFAKDFPEMYEIVRTVIAVHHRRLYRVEVLKDHTAPERFKVHFSIQERLVIKPAHSGTKKGFKKVWVDLTLPWVETYNADSALNQALLQLSKLKS
jgi:hypothetical protein